LKKRQESFKFTGGRDEVAPFVGRISFSPKIGNVNNKVEARGGRSIRKTTKREIKTMKTPPWRKCWGVVYKLVIVQEHRRGQVKGGRGE